MYQPAPVFAGCSNPVQLEKENKPGKPQTMTEYAILQRF
jgi:hypothetical protein